MSHRYSRRGALGSLAKLAAAAPLAQLIPRLERQAEAAGPIKRFLIVYHPNGVYGPDWLPTGADGALTFPSSTKSLEPYKQHLLFTKGIDIKEDAANRAHPCQEVCLTGAARPYSENGTSLDQLVAGHLAKTVKTRFPYLQMHSGWVDIEASRSPWYLNGQPLVGERIPGLAFEKMFGAGVPAMTGAAPMSDTELVNALRVRTERRKSVMDYVAGELELVKRDLGQEDRLRFEAHTDAIRQIEHLFTAAPAAAGGACAAPKAPAAGDPGYGPAGTIFTDLAVTALSCDLTRVVALGWGRGGGGPRFSQFGSPYDKFSHHAITHGDGGAKSQANKIDAWHAEQVAYLLGKLTTTRDANGPLIDTTLVLWANEFGAWTGSQHSRASIPYMIAGGKWAFKTGGRVASFNAEAHNKLLVSVAQAMDVPVMSVGSTTFGAGPLAGL